MFFLIAALFILHGCGDTSASGDKQLAGKIDSLSRKLDSVTAMLARKDSLKETVAKKDTVLAISPLPKTAKQDTGNRTTSPAKKTAVVQKSPGAGDTTFYYYASSPKRISVIITPWDPHQKRKVMFFDRSGTKTYEIEDERMSYSSTTEINSFYPDGGASKATTHMNPGASMYWYETYITFGPDNEPQWKESQKFPQQNLSLPDKYYWDAGSKSWKKQEIVHEQDVPH
ncbi:MAG TPA: hypothetical protein VFU15_09090 [Bacteroidia bacterium]|nr:hypothetical protein [Bacteroidia bacterium]